MLIFGGRCDNGSNNDLYKFSLAAKMWTKLEPIVETPSDMPKPREGHVALLIDGDKMLVHGGINESNKCFNDAYILLGLH